MLGDIIGIIIIGAIFGVLARLFMRGRQDIGVLWTILLGIAGALVGYWISAALGVSSTKGIDWIRDIISIIAAMIFIAVYMSIRGRSRAHV